MKPLTKDQSTLTLDRVGLKVGHRVKSQKKLINTLEATFSAQSTSDLVKMMSLTKSWSFLKLGHVVSKSRSPVQIIEKALEHSRGLIFAQINFKLGQNGSVTIVFEFIYLNTDVCIIPALVKNLDHVCNTLFSCVNKLDVLCFVPKPQFFHLKI